ncbi:hypothetical protein JKF63_00339 [Porcisia hertigi]|uniref:EFHB C-terminal EF-hand domain-containing protein n=1 Tax=Porcisia hertigi TaxID=2761500 RepID=A0A836L0Z4_9TRYP|nr:hypothetical protein JKF63_00339 [Porcisia hertigi]
MSFHPNTQARLNRIAPQLRPAGVHGDLTEPTVGEVLSSYNPDGVTTPVHIRSFHHRGYDVGEQRRHWGLAKDAPVDPQMRHGVKRKEEDGADGCLRPEMYANKMTALLDAERETHYLSSRRKPLGHAPVPQDPVPVPFGGFGISQKKDESIQSLLAGYRVVEVLHPAGEQLTRNYDWESAGIDPTQHRFGKPSAKVDSSMASALRSAPATQLVSKLAKDYKTTVAKELSKSKSYGFDDPAEWDEKKRGHITKIGATGTASSHFQTEQPSVRELMLSWAETAPGSGTDKAASVKASQQGLSSSADAQVAAKSEAPADPSAASSMSLARTLNDDVHSHQLIYPCHYVTLGVESKYFAGGRSLEDIRRLSHKCGFGLSDAAIDTVFSLVAKGGSTCSIEEFKNEARAKGYM